MSTTPPARRRVNPAVTVRRAQSERRQSSAWRLPWPLGTPGHKKAPEPAWVDHHHTPRTALIPPAIPRMVGHSQSVLRGGNGSGGGGGGGESPTGSLRHMPLAPVSTLQLPPMALGTPPMLLLPPHTLDDRLAQDRLSAFLAGETLPHQPTSILSCSDEPLYESLVSIFTDPEDAITNTETEHEYQQITITRNPTKEDRIPAVEALQQEEHKGGSGRKSGSPTVDNQPHKMKVKKLNTLDVKPECHKAENKCSCAANISIDELWENVELIQSANTSSQSASSQDSHKSAILLTDNYHRTESESDMNDSDIYEEASVAQTVIHISPIERSSDHKMSKSSESINCRRSSIQHNLDYSNSETEYHITPGNNSCISTPTKKTNYTTKSSSDEPPIRVQLSTRTRPPDPVYPPLTIELPESKPSPRKSERSTKNKSTQASLNTPHIITTLDPPLKNKSKANKNNSQHTDMRDNTTKHHNHINGHTDTKDKTSRSQCQINGLNIDSRDKTCRSHCQINGHIDTWDKTIKPNYHGNGNIELRERTMKPNNQVKVHIDPKENVQKPQSQHKGQTDNIATMMVNLNCDYEEGMLSDCDSCSSTLAGSTTIYLSDDDNADTSSIYSSVAEIYSMITTDTESLVYVYQPPPRRSRHRYSTLSYRFPTGGSSGGSSGSGSSSQDDTVTFVEPSYRPSNLSVGSRGHLKIDYSWSWNRLDDFVRTTSPREAGMDDNTYSAPTHHLLGFQLMPWERPLDIVAG